MKQKFWQTNEFKTLEKEWYERLEKESFQDIEKRVNGKTVLKQRATNCYRGSGETERQNKQMYYELLGYHFHRETGFKDEIEEFVMEKRAAGHSIIDISRILKRVRERFYRNTIRRIVKKYETKWAIKKK